MLLTINHRTFNHGVLVFILVFIGGCKGRDEQTKHSPTYNFAEIQGQISETNQINTLRRWFFVGSDGSKAVVSKINSITDLTGHKSYTTRYLHEYLQNDSLFIFDSGDSTCICLALANAGYMELNRLPLSASWLFFKYHKSERKLTDTLTICGYCCNKQNITNGYLWVCGNEPMAIETLNQGISRSERIIRCVNDTILHNGFLEHPLGYRELLPNR